MEEQKLSKSEQERQARLKGVKTRRLKLGLIWLLVLVVIAGLSYGLVVFSRKAESRKPGLQISDQGRIHISPGQPHEPYNSNPPTSGPHFPEWAKWGIYEAELPDEQLVHNLEHGGVWISYRDKDNRELIEELKAIADDYSIKVILTHRPKNDSAIAAVAWNRLFKLEAFDEKLIRRFIKAFINRGPEQVPF